MDRCSYRVVPQEEIDNLAEDVHSAFAPPKLPFKKTQADIAIGVEDTLPEIAAQEPVDVPKLTFNAPPAKRQASKRSLDVFELSEDDEIESEEPEAEAADSDFQPEKPEKIRAPVTSYKRARHSASASTYSPKVSTRRKSGKA